MNMSTIAILLVLAACLIIGCVDNADADSIIPHSSVSDFTTIADENIISGLSPGVYRFHDDEMNITCYLYLGSGGAIRTGGISCIPDSEIYGDV